MQFDTPIGVIEIINEPAYSFGSADNVRQYPNAYLLDHEYSPTSVHGVFLDGTAIAVFGDAGGCTGIHKNSLLFYNGTIYVAVGRHVVSFTTRPFVFRWSLKVDLATCFGVHVNSVRHALVSHGELEICRFSEDGKILWSTSGADIFSEEFALKAEWIEAIDFNRQIYRFGYEDGSIFI